MQPHVIAGGHSKERGSRAPRGPIEITILLLAGVNQVSIGRDDIQRLQVDAAQTKGSGIPAMAAAHHEAAHPDVHSMRRWRE
jgi:hypothetical protein